MRSVKSSIGSVGVRGEEIRRELEGEMAIACQSAELDLNRSLLRRPNPKVNVVVRRCAE